MTKGKLYLEKLVPHFLLPATQIGNIGSLHARQRMNERNVTVQDIKICAGDGEFIADGNEIKVIGLDLNNEELTIIYAYRDGTLIVTVK